MSGECDVCGAPVSSGDLCIQCGYTDLGDSDGDADGEYEDDDWDDDEDDDQDDDDEDDDDEW